MAVFIMMAVLSTLAGYEQDEWMQLAIRAHHEGPQAIDLYDKALSNVGVTEAGAGLSPAALSELEQLNGVHGIAPSIALVGCDEGNCREVAVGSCAQLALILKASGCDDSRAAYIEGWDPDDHANYTFSIPNPEQFELRASRGAEEGPPLAVVAPSEPNIQVGPAEQVEAWGHIFQIQGFVPTSLAGGFKDTDQVRVIAEGGVDVQQRLAAWADLHGWKAHPLATGDYTFLNRAKAITWGTCGGILAIALVTLTLGALDRARDRRRAVARQIMVGVPAGVLRISQAVQMVLPALTGTLLAVIAGIVIGGALSNISVHTIVVSPNGTTWAAIASVVVAVTLLALLSTWPLIRRRLDPALLRRE
jgi:hypothetical protein